MLTDEQREEKLGKVRQKIRQTILDCSEPGCPTNSVDVTIGLRNLFEQERLCRSGEEIQAYSPTERSPWIKVKDELPLYSESINLAIEDGKGGIYVTSGELRSTNEHGNWWRISDNISAGRESVLAWMPIPEYKS